MGWFQQVMDFLRQFWPFEIVYSYQQGVRFWCGNDTAELEPGLHVFLPFFGRIEVMDTKPDVLRLAHQDVTTRDGVALKVAANVLYEVHDARAAFVNVQHVTDNIGDACRTGIAQGVREHEYAELLAKQGTVEDRIADAVAKAAGEWGVQVHRITFTDFIKTKSLSVSGV